MKPAELDALIAGNVRAHLARHRMTQQDLATELRWTRFRVHSLLTRGRRLTFAESVDLCRVLEISLAQLIDGAPPSTFKALRISERRK